MLNKVKAFILKNRDNAMLFGILLVITALVTMRKPSFFSLGTLQSISYQLPEMGLLTMAMMLAMLSGGINLSCIASANLSGIVMALIMTNCVAKGADSIPTVALAIACGLAVSVAAGFVNGLIIAVFKIPAMLVTLGTQMLLNGLCLVITRGATISGYPASFKFLGNGKIAGIPTPMILFAAALIFMVLLLKNMPYGSKIYLFGSNNIATEYSGVNDKALLIKTYTLSGFFVGIAAVILTSRFNSAAAGYAGTYLMQAILIAVLGGVNPNGGGGKVGGMLLGVIIVQVVSSGLNLLRVSSHLITAIYGVILLIAVSIRSYKSVK